MWGLVVWDIISKLADKKTKEEKKKSVPVYVYIAIIIYELDLI